jgi:hypothetical protein
MRNHFNSALEAVGYWRGYHGLQAPLLHRGEKIHLQLLPVTFTLSNRGLFKESSEPKQQSHLAVAKTRLLSTQRPQFVITACPGSFAHSIPRRLTIHATA